MYGSPDWTESRATSWFGGCRRDLLPGREPIGQSIGMLAATRGVQRKPSEGRVNAAEGGGGRG